MKSCGITSEKSVAIGVFLFASASLPMAAVAAPIQTVKVDCAQGHTIARALRHGDDERKPLVVVVQGTCNENVTIDRDDVTLQGDPGATVNGPDAGSNTITVTASRVTIDGLTVSGGRNGIVGQGARGMTVRNSTIQATGRTGVVYFQGASGRVDSCTIQNNTLRDGIAVESSSVTVINSLITQNGRSGVNIVDGGSGRIGIDNNNLAAGNTISSNASSGINLFTGATAFIAGNTISGNGTNPALNRNGIQVTMSSADIIGGNSITGHPGFGVSTRSANVAIGDTSFGLPSVNTMTGNGLGGVFGFLGSSFLIRDATISGNTGAGVILSTKSVGQMFANTIDSNTSDGIRLVLGSGLILQTPTSTVTGNGGFGINCTDGESSVGSTVPPFLVVAPPANALGGVSPACTGF